MKLTPLKVLKQLRNPHINFSKHYFKNLSASIFVSGGYSNLKDIMEMLFYESLNCCQMYIQQVITKILFINKLGRGSVPQIFPNAHTEHVQCSLLETQLMCK